MKRVAPEHNEKAFPVQGCVYQFAKRCMDICFGAMGVMLTGLAAIPIGLAIRMDTAGPVFFRQTRVGRKGKPFAFFKFRTMIVDATLEQWQLDKLNETTGPIFKMRDDPRVTRVGRVLRRYSLDELPQFWNVLKGDMSLVGPRPPLVHEVAQYSDHERQRLLVKQGMTGLWQVSGRSRLSFEKMVALDLDYARRASLWLDLWILAKTLPAVFGAVGSY